VSRHHRAALAWAALALALVVAGLIEVARGATPPPRRAMAVEVVALRDLAAGARLTAGALGTVRVPARYASGGAVTAVSETTGRRLAVPVAAGNILMRAELETGEQIAAAREVAVRLDEAAGLPAGDLAGARADVLLVQPGRGTAPVVVLADVLVVSAQSSSGTAVATLRLPVAAVSQVVAAEGRGSLRLVVRASAGVP
jgi:hypothetical protein